MSKKTKRSKSSTGSWYDDEYYSSDYKSTSSYYKPYSPGDYTSSEKKSKAVTKYADYSGGSKYWEKWEKQYSSYSSLFDDREKRLKLRNSFEKIARELYVPLELRFDAQEKQSSVVKTSRLLMSLDKVNIARIKDKKMVREILSASDRLPENATLEDNTLFSI